MLIVVTSLVLLLGDEPRRKEPPANEELAAISRRGRDLAEYDVAAWHASDAVQGAKPPAGAVVRYIAEKTATGWTVAFGRLDDKQERFLVAFEATQEKDPEHFDVKRFDPPREDTGFFRSSARAIDVALKDFAEHFEPEQRPYNVAVLPADEGRIHLYLVPAPTKPGVWPVGGDVRYLMSTDGRTIAATRRLHRAIIESPAPKDADNSRLAMGFHTHVLDDVPEDTDVFYVLTRKPAVPEIVATPQYAFQVGTDGAIKYLGKADTLLKKR